MRHFHHHFAVRDFFGLQCLCKVADRSGWQVAHPLHPVGARLGGEYLAEKCKQFWAILEALIWRFEAWVRFKVGPVQYIST